MLAVVGANAHTVQILFVIEQLAVTVIYSAALNFKLLCESLCFSGNEISQSHYLNIGHLFIAADMRLGNPSCSYDSDFNLFRGVNNLCFLIELKSVQSRSVCHCYFLQYYITNCRI